MSKAKSMRLLKRLLV